MPKTKKKITPKKTTKKVVAKVKKSTTFSTEFTNALLVVFAAGMVLFAYVIFRVYG